MANSAIVYVCRTGRRVRRHRPILRTIDVLSTSFSLGRRISGRAIASRL